MYNKEKVINFLQDFGAARIDQLQKLFNKYNNNFIHLTKISKLK